MIDSNNYLQVEEKERGPDRDSEHLDIKYATRNEYGDKIAVIKSNSSISDRTAAILVDGLYNPNVNFQWDGDMGQWTVQLSAIPVFLLFCQKEIPNVDVRVTSEVVDDYFEFMGEKIVNENELKRARKTAGNDEPDNTESGEAQETDI